MAKKKHTLSTGSMVAIVVGIIVVIFMLLTFIDHQIDSNTSPANITCDEGEVFVTKDGECRTKCGDDGYCYNNDICYNEECYIYPHGAIKCIDELREERDAFNVGIAIVNKLPSDTFDEALFRHEQVVDLFNKLKDSSKHCLKELDEMSFLLDELGYNMAVYFNEWNDFVFDMDSILLRQEEIVEEYSN